ncbi:MAG: protein kinase [Planctomycetales bacterium]|nr:protein kinase [Planctomycetales bacterium]MCA9167873.1 protein kinase [Planctomycetales bacterium]
MSGRGQVDDIRRTKILDLVTQVLERQDRGESIDSEQLASQHPDLMPELAEELSRQQMIAAIRRNFEQGAHGSLADITPDVSRQSLDTASLVVRCPHCANTVEILADLPWSDITCVGCGNVFSLVSDRFATHEAPTLKKIAHFELIERIGVGGFGTVWKARDTILDRAVALKLPRRGQLTEEEIDKFLREARAAAQLRHPNIVSVHEVGRTDETVYIVSDLVRGVSLSDWMAIRSPSPREVAEICFRISDALEHAHEMGIVHRDLKPGNIMVDARNEPHIMDFGLAKREAGEVTMTIEGQLLGTPAYMAPEQALGQAHESSPRTDVYSLGVIMFELLTGELPFRGNTSMLIHQVVNDEPPSPRKLNNHIPIDLETICLRCLEKDPARRFASAGGLAAELRRFLDGEPILSRPIGPVLRFTRWVKRHMTVTGLAAAAILALIIGTSASTYFALRASGFRQQADELRTATEQKDKVLEKKDQDLKDQGKKILNQASSVSFAYDVSNTMLRGAYNRQLQSASLVSSDRPYRVIELLENEERCPTQLRDITWHLLHGRHNYPLQRIEIPQLQRCRALQFSADAQRLAASDERGWMILQRDDVVGWVTTAWQPLPAAAVTALRHRDLALVGVAAPPVASSSADQPDSGHVKPALWICRQPGETPTPWLSSINWPAVIHSLEFSLDDRFLICVGRTAPEAPTPVRYLIDVDNQAIVSQVDHAANCVEFAELPPTLLSGVTSIDPQAAPVIVVNCLQTGALQTDDLAAAALPQLSTLVRHVCSGLRGMATADDTAVQVHALPFTGTPLRLRLPPDGLQHLAVSAEMDHLAMVTNSGAVCIWDLKPTSQSRSYTMERATSFEFSPNAKMLAVATNREIRVVDLVSDNELSPIATPSPVVSLSWSPASSRLAFVMQNGEAQVADFSGARLVVPIQSEQPLVAIAFRDDDRVFTGNRSGELSLYDVTQKTHDPIDKYDDGIAAIAYKASSEDFATSLAVATGRRIHITSPKRPEIWVTGHEANVRRITLSRNEAYILSCDEQGHVLRSRANSLKDERESTQLAALGCNPTTAEQSVDGQTVMTLQADRVQFWDAMTGDYRGVLPLGYQPIVARFSPFPLEPTTMIAVLGANGTLEVWRTEESGRQPTLFLDGVVRDFAWFEKPLQLLAFGELPFVAAMDPVQTDDRRLYYRDDVITAAATVSSADGTAKLLASSLRQASVDLPSSAVLQSFAVRSDTYDLFELSESDRSLESPVVRLRAIPNSDETLALNARGQMSRLWSATSQQANAVATMAIDLSSVGDGVIVSSFDVARNGLQMLIGLSDGIVSLRKLDASQMWAEVAVIQAHDGQVQDVAALPDGRWISAGHDGRLRLWSPELQPLAETSGPIAHRIAVGPNQSIFAVASGNTIQLWQADEQGLQQQGEPLAEHRGRIAAIAFSPDGKVLVSSGQDRAIKFWAVAGQALSRTRGIIPASVRAIFEGNKGLPLPPGVKLKPDVKSQPSP